MGYRSQIAINIYGDKIDSVKALYDTEYDLLSPYDQEDLNNTCSGSPWVQKETGLEFFFTNESVKWYTGFGAVDFIEDVVCLARELGLNVEYVKIGEEIDDVVAEYDGDEVEYRLEVDRSISINF